MDKNRLLAIIAAILCTLNEQVSEFAGCQESMLYILCSMDMQVWQTVRDIMIKANFVTIKGNYVTITQNGRDMAKECEARLTSK
jgi:hypothetical protein